MINSILHAFHICILLCFFRRSVSQATSGKLPGCRYSVYDSSTKWELPEKYRWSTTTAYKKKGVCLTVKKNSTVHFEINDSLWILGDGLSPVDCGGIKYCVTSDYDIVLCGQIGCQETTCEDISCNTCDNPISKYECLYG
jgi:hypothetical protein